MEAMNGPQWKQLPMLMTPEEVRSTHSHSYEESMGEHEAGVWEHGEEGQKIWDLRHKFRESPPRGDMPAVIYHNDPTDKENSVSDHAGPGFGDGHHRAIAAAQEGHLLPVVHVDKYADYNREMDEQHSQTRSTDPSWISKWGWSH